MVNILNTPWRLMPLSGKYYGTEIVDTDGNSMCGIWSLTNRGTLSVREIANLHPGEDPREVMCDSHYESQHDYNVAVAIIEKING